MKKMIKTLALSFGLLMATALVQPVQPAQAAIQRSSDFSQGNTIGVGLFGLSYDYGVGPFSIGAAFSSDAIYSFASGSRLRPGLRAMWRFMEIDGLSAGVLAGVQYDPGTPGGRAYLTPDLGVGMAYNFKIFDLPTALRLNLTLALSSSSTGYYFGSYPTSNSNVDEPTPNFFQRLSIGPMSSLELAFMPSPNFEITLGGGTWLGMRLKI
jgi:hypothetical protein